MGESSYAPGPAKQPAKAAKARAPAPTPKLKPIGAPAGHGSHELKLHIADKGNWSADAVLTLELGPTGVGASGKRKDASGQEAASARMQALKQTTSVQLDGMVGRLETAVLNAEGDVTVFEGFKVAVEVNAGTVGLGADDISLDLGSISVKAVGDAGALLGLPEGMTAALDLRVTYTIPATVLATAAAARAKTMAYMLAADEADAVGRELAQRGTAHRAALARRESLVSKGAKAGDAAFDKIEREIVEHARAIEHHGKQVKGVLERAGVAREGMERAISGTKSKLGKRLARALGQHGIKMAARAFAKLLPVLNVVSIAFDIYEIVQLVRALVKGQVGSGDGGDGGGSEPSRGADEPADPGKAADKSTAPAPDGEAAAPNRARIDALPVRARKLLQLTARSGQGVALGDAELLSIGMMLEGLDDAALAQVAKLLAGAQPATNVEGAFAAIDAAIDEVRNPSGLRTVVVDGVQRRDLAVAIADGDAGPSPSATAPVTGKAASKAEVKRLQLDGPITSPPADELDLTDPMIVARHLPGEILEAWFALKQQELVLTTQFQTWLAEAKRSSAIVGVQHTITRSADSWAISLRFKVSGRGSDVNTIQHDFFVHVEAGKLVFEPFTLYDATTGQRL